METLARECADQTFERMRSALPSLTEKQAQVLKISLGLTYLEGFGRGQRHVGAMAMRSFDAAIASVIGRAGT